MINLARFDSAWMSGSDWKTMLLPKSVLAMRIRSLLSYSRSRMTLTCLILGPKPKSSCRLLECPFDHKRRRSDIHSVLPVKSPLRRHLEYGWKDHSFGAPRSFGQPNRRIKWVSVVGLSINTW
jgi:hypothetical protein